VRDQKQLSANRHGWLYHTLWLYGVFLLLGYLLFQVWPYAYVWAAFPLSESILLVGAVVNIRQFIVERYIWKLRRDPNYRIVVGEGARWLCGRPRTRSVKVAFGSVRRTRDSFRR